MIRDRDVLVPERGGSADDRLDIVASVAVSRVQMQVAADVGPGQQPRNRALRGSCQFVASGSNLGRHARQAERGINLIFGRAAKVVDASPGERVEVPDVSVGPRGPNEGCAEARRRIGLDDDQLSIDCQTASGVTYPLRILRAGQHGETRDDRVEAAKASGREEGRAWRNLAREPGDRPLEDVPGAAEGNAQCRLRNADC